MLHMPYQMQEMHKGNYTYATKELPVGAECSPDTN
jgi:hypothetical protein